MNSPFSGTAPKLGFVVAALTSDHLCPRFQSPESCFGAPCSQLSLRALPWMLPPLPPAGLCLLYTMPALSCLEYCNKMVLSSSTSAASTALVCKLETDKLCAWLLTGLGSGAIPSTDKRSQSDYPAQAVWLSDRRRPLHQCDQAVSQGSWKPILALTSLRKTRRWLARPG